MSTTICSLGLAAPRQPRSSRREALRFTAGAVVDALACAFLVLSPLLPPGAADLEFIVLHLMSATLILPPSSVPAGRSWLAFTAVLALPIAGVGVAWLMLGARDGRTDGAAPRRIPLEG